jgi:hypothetical protein
MFSGGEPSIHPQILEPDRLDPDLRGRAGRVAGLANARPIPELTTIVESAGLTVTCVERHDDALAATITRVIDRLRAARIVAPSFRPGLDIARGIDLARRAADAVQRDAAGYVLLAATRP